MDRPLGGTMETAASFEVRNAPSSYPTEADDARTWEVGLCRRSYEAGEQGGGICWGVGGAKGRDQGECGSAKHAPGSGPGKCVTGAGTHTASCEAKEEGKAHHAFPPYQCRTAQAGVLRN